MKKKFVDAQVDVNFSLRFKTFSESFIIKCHVFKTLFYTKMHKICWIFFRISCLNKLSGHYRNFNIELKRKLKKKTTACSPTSPTFNIQNSFCLSRHHCKPSERWIFVNCLASIISDQRDIDRRCWFFIITEDEKITKVIFKNASCVVKMLSSVKYSKLCTLELMYRVYEGSTKTSKTITQRWSIQMFMHKEGGIFKHHFGIIFVN